MFNSELPVHDIDQLNESPQRPLLDWLFYLRVPEMLQPRRRRIRPATPPRSRNRSRKVSAQTVPLGGQMIDELSPSGQTSRRWCFCLRPEAVNSGELSSFDALWFGFYQGCAIWPQSI